MQKYLSKILISMIVVAIFLAPISAGMKINKTKAQTANTDNLSKTEIKTRFIKGENVSVEVKIPADSIPPNNKDYNIDVVSYGCAKQIKGNANKDTSNCIFIERKTQKEIESSKTYTIDVKINTYNYYGIQTYIYERGILNNTTLYLKEIDFNKNGDVDFQTNPGENNVGNNITGSNNIDKSNYNDSYFNCSGLLPWTDLTCKTAYLLYFAIFVPMSSFTWLSAKLLDFFVYYSTNSSSYNGKFVNSSWAAVRDIANIFFIISLIYVAIKTILGLNVTDNKRIVGMVVIIGLIINFSLFTTKVVIDASNILAKVFYNNITSEDESGKKLDAEKGGQKSITVGLVNKFDPQEIMAESFKGQEGLFIFITLLSIILMGFMIYIFISVSMLFVARVVSLWLSMIFSPIAFISFTLPFEIPAFGHKEWLPNLIKNAFLAPIFIFFLYIIILFGDSMKNIPYDISSTGGGVGGYLDAAMKDIIPFSIVFILLLKSKELAVKFSGEIGQAVVKGAQMVGGLALGAATGGTALLASKTIGAKALSIANNDELRAKAASGEKDAQRKLALANTLAKSSFDFRQTGAGKWASKTSGMDFNKGTGFIGLNSEKFKGGQKAELEKAKEKEIEKTKSYEMTGEAASKQNILAEKAKTQNKRAEEYKKDKEEAKLRSEEGSMKFNEEEFKSNYEKGGRIHILGKNVTSGSIDRAEEVKTATETNQDRRNAYANKLQEKADMDKARGAVKTFFAEWGKGMKGMTTTKAGIATTLATGGMTGGIGAGVTIVGGGFLHALKEILGAKSVRPTNSEVIAAIRKGENPNKQLINELKKMTEKGHSDSGKLSDIAKKMTSHDKKETSHDKKEEHH